MKIFDYADPGSFVSRLRRRRGQLLREIIEDIVYARGECRILDVGGEARNWLNIFGADWLRRNAIHVTLLNHTDEYVGRHPDPELFTIVIADACALPYSDHVYDLVHSNSVIEHVGEYGRQCRFAEQMRRVGRRSYVQTPARCFPLEPHTRFPWFQYLPSRVRAWLFMHMQLGTYPRLSRERAEYFDRELQLLTCRQVARLFPDAYVRRERLFGLTKSYMAVSIGTVVVSPK